MKLLLLSLVSLTATACLAPVDTSDTEDLTATTYVDIADFPSTDQGAWYDLVGKLNGEFAQLCGDTFCEGDYANLTPLTFNCSVTSKEGKVHDCGWTFAASRSGVDSTTAAISVDAPTYQCHVAPKATAAALIALLSGSNDAIHATLPGLTTSIYDSLAGCFTHPIGHTPVTSTFTSPPKYVAAADYYTTHANQATWAATKAALVLGFDNICGDTFCGSDYGDLHSLDFVCAITKSTGNVKGCAWTFGGSYPTVATSGKLAEVSRTFTCHVPVAGTLAQLITTITAAGPTEPIQRTLPGETTSAYDALGGCLP